MKRFILLLVCTLSLFGEESLWDYHPLRAGGNAAFITPANLEMSNQGSVRFQKEDAYISMMVPVSKTSFFIPKIDYTHFVFNWDQNPRFSKTNFQYMQYSLTFFSYWVEKWRWILRLDYNLDIDNMDNPGLYSLYKGLIWGQYEMFSKWHYHVGALGYSGMEGQTVYPILGIDYAPNDKWLFQAIFPMEYSVQYNFWTYFRCAAQVRPHKERFRVGKFETSPRSIFSYSSVGGELNLRLKIERRLEIEVYGGYNFGGKFYIKDRHGHNALYRKFDGAPYLGASLDFGF